MLEVQGCDEVQKPNRWRLKDRMRFRPKPLLKRDRTPGPALQVLDNISDIVKWGLSKILMVKAAKMRGAITDERLVLRMLSML